jgi:hypothetical protein
MGKISNQTKEESWATKKMTGKQSLRRNELLKAYLEADDDDEKR